MVICSCLQVDFWWNAYDTSNFITNRLPTKTAFGYQTPYEGVFNETPDLSLLREEYFQELTKMKFEMATDESTVDSFEHFVGAR